MARLQIMNLEGERRVEVILSRRNLLTLLQKLVMPGSMQQIENNDCWEDGVQTPFYPHEVEASDLARTKLVLRSEDDHEHYAKRPAGPGLMHPVTERFVRKHGGAPGELLSLGPFGVDGEGSIPEATVVTRSRQLLAFKRGPTVDLRLDDLIVEVTEGRVRLTIGRDGASEHFSRAEWRDFVRRIEHAIKWIADNTPEDVTGCSFTVEEKS